MKSKVSKGKRLNWKPLKGSGAKLTWEQVQSRMVTAEQIKRQQQFLAKGQLSLLVP